MQPGPNSPEHLYKQAYAAHYTLENLLDALFLYAAVVMEHPNSSEARNAAGQIHNIKSRLATGPEVVRADLSLAIGQITKDVPLWFREMCREKDVAV